MTDREKIVNAIEKAKKQSEEYAQDRIIVPFKETDIILAMLKEKEPKYVNSIAQQISCLSGTCPKCGKMLNTTCNKNFCGDCGQAVKWDD